MTPSQRLHRHRPPERLWEVTSSHRLHPEDKKLCHRYLVIKDVTLQNCSGGKHRMSSAHSNIEPFLPENLIRLSDVVKEAFAIAEGFR